MVRAGGSASWTSNICDPPVPGRGGLGAQPVGDKQADVQAFPPLGSQPTVHSSASSGRADREPRRTVHPPLEPIGPVDGDFRIVPGRDWLPPVAPASGTRWVVRRIRPAGGQDRSPKSLGHKTVVTTVVSCY